MSRRKRLPTTFRNRDAHAVPDLAQRDFSAVGPDRLWVADIIYISTLAGFVYLAAVVDALSRRVVDWSMAAHLKTELVLDAHEMALLQRRPMGGIYHSSQGSQYTSFSFGRRCQ